MKSLTNILVVLLIISFVLQFTIPGYRDALVFSSDIALFEPWRFFTATLLHFNILHLFANTYAFYIVGNALETKITKSDILKILFLGSAIGYVYQFLTYSYGIDNIAIGLGASAGTSALLAASALLLSETKVKVFFIPIRLKHLAIIFFAFEIIAFALGNTTTYHEAHLVGGLFGLLYKKYIIKTS
ncbi:MAG: rhomboid family intramembrane serine protease [Candidatus Micrarchaeota archaeon]|nr:rhomboid family intramembrane serine protease [Candidatus Micrarchaeota archaeon]